jgi:hypothetical protein
MFDGEEKPRDISSSLLIKQLALIPLFCFVVAGLAADLAIQVTGWHFTGYLAAALAGMAIGYWVQLHDDRMDASLGRWIWIPPVCLVLFAMTYDISVGQSASHFFNGSGPGLSGVEMFVFTLPAVACCFYAVGITLASRKQKAHGRGEPKPN